MTRTSASLRERFTDVFEVFLEPVPREDADVRARVQERYGRDPARRMVDEAGTEGPEARGAVRCTDERTR